MEIDTDEIDDNKNNNSDNKNNNNSNNSLSDNNSNGNICNKNKKNENNKDNNNSFQINNYISFNTLSYKILKANEDLLENYGDLCSFFNDDRPIPIIYVKFSYKPYFINEKDIRKFPDRKVWLKKQTHYIHTLLKESISAIDQNENITSFTIKSDKFFQNKSLIEPLIKKDGSNFNYVRKMILMK